MEIIKHGETYQKQTCETCKCTFAYTILDTYYEKDDKGVKCPECGSFNELKWGGYQWN
ncbi:MAG: hypothetical protein IJ272_09390 [Clostridia bacterium]|nr:hypothetical protein [Clostridia bacterium]